jgi:hypothetical protein
MDHNTQKKAFLFFSKRKDLQETRVKRNPCPEKSIKKLMAESPPISKESIDDYFIDQKGLDTSSKILLDIRKSLHKTRNTINQFPSQKRFFINETIAFFQSSTYMGKVIPALMDVEETEHQYQLLQFVNATFSRLNRNIETIISTPELFDQASLHAQRGGLYSLSMDIARSISNLFKEEYLSGFRESSSEIARMSEVLKPCGGKGNAGSKAACRNLTQNFIPQPERFRAVCLEFISQIQTHDLLLLYAQKRHAYYKRFLVSIVSGSKLLGPFVSSIILSGSLLANSQLTPGQPLILSLTSETDFHLPETRKSLNQFVDQLAPSTVLDIISDYKRSTGEVISGKGLGKTENKKGLLDRSKTNLETVRKLLKGRFKT